MKVVWKTLQNWWKNAQMTSTEYYLSQSSDIVDLEMRMRELERNRFNFKGSYPR